MNTTQNRTPLRPLLTADQVCEILSISRRTLSRYVAEDPRFPTPVRLSARCVSWKADELEGYIDRKQITEVRR